MLIFGNFEKWSKMITFDHFWKILKKVKNSKIWSILIKNGDSGKFPKIEKWSKNCWKNVENSTQILGQKSTPQKSALQTRYSVDPFFGRLMICVSMVIDKLENSDILTPPHFWHDFWDRFSTHIFDTKFFQKYSKKIFREIFKFSKNFQKLNFWNNFCHFPKFWKTRKIDHFWSFLKNFQKFKKLKNLIKSDLLEKFKNWSKLIIFKNSGKNLYARACSGSRKNTHFPEFLILGPKGVRKQFSILMRAFDMLLRLTGTKIIRSDRIILVHIGRKHQIDTFWCIFCLFKPICTNIRKNAENYISVLLAAKKRKSP